MKYEATAALRHTPKQMRGQRKVEHILRSAEALFAEVGFENATTNAIAARAGVSIGSLYQFFASKEAILEAMADRYLDQTRVELNRRLDDDRNDDLGEYLGSMLEMTIKLQEQRPYFLQCLAVSRPSPALAQAVNALTEEIAGQVVRLLQRRTHETDLKTLKLRSRIIVMMISSLLPLALHARGKERTRVVDEIKLVLLSYLGPTLKDRGV
jgi:AcrR family transcriptional regulator